MLRRAAAALGLKFVEGGGAAAGAAAAPVAAAVENHLLARLANEIEDVVERGGGILPSARKTEETTMIFRL